MSGLEVLVSEGSGSFFLRRWDMRDDSIDFCIAELMSKVDLWNVAIDILIFPTVGRAVVRRGLFELELDITN